MSSENNAENEIKRVSTMHGFWTGVLVASLFWWVAGF